MKALFQGFHSTSIMRDDVRLDVDSADEEIHLSAVPPAMRSFAEEVKKRSSKPRNMPLNVPQKLSVSEFNTAMVHFYRGEIQRSNVWRNRLDTTTNWAVITAGATLSFVFSSPNNPHFAIPINTVLISIFMFMEARRLRYYEVWAKRIRIIETGYIAPMLSHRSVPDDKEWADHLAADMATPHFTISEWEAVGRRLRANYIWIFLLLGLSWTLKVYMHPTAAKSFEEFVEHAQVGLAPGWMVIVAGIFFNLLILFIAYSTKSLNDSASEVLPMEKFDWNPLKEVSDWAESKLPKRNPIRRAKKARQRVRSVHQTEG